MTTFADPVARPCPVCGSIDVDSLHRQRFTLADGHPLASGYQVVACRCCGLVYADTVSTHADFARFYAQHSKYAHAATAPGGGDSAADERRLQAAADRIAALAPRRGAAVLDLGCATGGLLRCLRERGFQHLRGVDPSSECAAQASRYAEVAVATLDALHTLPAQWGRFEGVILSHVLEHLHLLRQPLAAVRDLVTPDGWLYVEVPDARRYVQFPLAPFHYFDTEHINHFSAPVLTRLLEEQGWRVLTGSEVDVPMTDEVLYPAFWLFARPSQMQPQDRPADLDLGQSVRRYIEVCAQGYAQARWQALAESCQPIIVWGVGSATTRLLADTALGTAAIVAFVDNNPATWGQRLLGREVIAPSALSGHNEAILVTSRLYGDAIERQIREELGLTNEVLRV